MEEYSDNETKIKDEVVKLLGTEFDLQRYTAISSVVDEELVAELRQSLSDVEGPKRNHRIKTWRSSATSSSSTTEEIAV